MKNSNKHVPSSINDQLTYSNSTLGNFFIHSLQEMYYAETTIATDFNLIKDQIVSPKLDEILKTHFAIHLKHKERLAKIFQLRAESGKIKDCKTFNALIAESKNHLSFFSNDIANWEIALILVSQKLTYYKIASYGGLAHLAIKLKYYKEATLLAVCVQEEEEFIANNLNGIIDAFMSSHIEGYKN